VNKNYANGIQFYANEQYEARTTNSFKECACLVENRVSDKKTELLQKKFGCSY